MHSRNCFVVVNRKVNEATRTKITSRGARFAVPNVVSLSFQMRATMHNVALDGATVGVNIAISLTDEQEGG
jgi:hypothetical protein